MIDTIRVKFPIAPEPGQLAAWDKRTYTKATGEIQERYIYNPTLNDGQVSVRCTYLPYDYEGQPMTTVELSLPKVVHGNNFTMIRDLTQAIEHADALLGKIEALPLLDIRDGILIRLDPCYNHQVGDLVPDYINAIGHMDYPHRRTKHHRDEGAEFRAKHVTTKFYDKCRETKDAKAAGILRQETSYLDAKRIAEILGKKQPTLLDVTPEWIAQILSNDLAKLRLDNRIIADHDTALAVLSKEYGPNAGLYYWGLLQMRFQKSKKLIAAKAKLHPRSLDRRLKAITDTGIAPTLTETREPLPPLKIDL